VCIVLQRVAGKDASKQFWKYHNEGILKKYKGQLLVGSLNTKKVTEPAPAPAPPAPTPAATPSPSESSSESSSVGPATAAPQDPYGDLIPFADPSWYQGVSVVLLTRLKRDASN
jgi:hypothetical protein